MGNPEQFHGLNSAYLPPGKAKIAATSRLIALSLGCGPAVRRAPRYFQPLNQKRESGERFLGIPKRSYEVLGLPRTSHDFLGPPRTP